jgi:hypothetical protein
MQIILDRVQTHLGQDGDITAGLAVKGLMHMPDDGDVHKLTKKRMMRIIPIIR